MTTLAIIKDSTDWNNTWIETLKKDTHGELEHFVAEELRYNENLLFKFYKIEEEIVLFDKTHYLES